MITIALIGVTGKIDIGEVPVKVNLSGQSAMKDCPASPLKVHPSNRRYFTDSRGKAIYLTGSHTWNNLLDFEGPASGAPFNYDDYLAFMKSYNHNFMRMWMLESFCNPNRYERTGPGLALDGKSKFNVRKFDESFFSRLRQRVIAAGEKGIYVSVMLFQGWSIESKEKGRNPWSGHPFNKDNNINGINGDDNGDGQGAETHTLRNSLILALQEAFVRKAVDTLNDLDHILYEISNESPATPEATAFQYHMIQYIHLYEAGKPKQHPVVMTWPCPPALKNDLLFASPAEAVSPGNWQSLTDDYMSDPPAADGRKVIISDTDHLWGIGGDHQWVWKSFLRGLNPIFMDPYTAPEHQKHTRKHEWELARKNMGYTLTYSRRVNLASMVPRNDLSSSRYCLSDPAKEYLVFLPSKGFRGIRWFYRLGLYRWLGWLTGPLVWNEKVIVDLPTSSETYRMEWFNPRTGEAKDGGNTPGGAGRSFTSPFPGGAVLYIYKTD